jgi:indole-3-glycerol phosphate synthase
MKDLCDAAHSYGLTVLCEAHDEREIERALSLPDAAIGVNARDLRDFTVSLERTASLAPMIPADRVRVGESGIFSNEDAQKLVDAGYNALLIGEYFLKSADRPSAVSSLVHSIKR